jgi:prepilin-type processing-associated H-X9-DG protein
LIAFFLPASSAAQAQARQVVCQSNLRQIVLAAHMYAQDHRVFVGYLPPNAAVGFVAKDRKEQLHPYLRQGRNNADVSVRAVWHCPANAMPDVQTGYGFNMLLNFKKLTAVRDSTATVAVVDSGRLDTGLPSLITHTFPPSRLTAANAVRPNARHRGRTANVAFLDGHVERHRLEPPFYPSPTWAGNGITDVTHPDYKDQLWDLH